MKKNLASIGRYVACWAGVAAVVYLCFRLVPVNATTTALLLLLLVLAAATTWGLAEAVFTSILGVLGLNYFFLPPVGTFTITDPENWVALFVFFATAFTASQLSAQARRRTAEAIEGRNELSKLYELSRTMLMDETRDAVQLSIARTGQILDLAYIAFFDAASGQIYGSLDGSGIGAEVLSNVAATGEATGDGRVIPVRLGTRIVGSLAMQGGQLSPAVRDSVASLLAINYERVSALDRAAAAEVAKRNEEFKSSLLDGLAHDLKTPLTSIRTCVTRLITIPPRTEEIRRELLSIIDQESLRLAKSITEAIELARIESQELHLSRETTNALDLVYVAVSETRDENHERYQINVPRDLALTVDSDLIRRALLQILENARKYAPPDSPIEIRAELEDGQITISVADRGPGFRPDELEKVFAKFYRGRSGTASVEGTGMGLAIAKGIIEAHGGRIRSANRPGGGAMISISLPAAN